MYDEIAHIEKIWAGFARNTQDHTLHVNFAAGLYRSLTMSAPDTGAYSWSVQTWPGHLAVSGDIGGGYVFARIQDMLEFFDTDPSRDTESGMPAVNLDYWSQKLCGSTKVRSFSPEVMTDNVEQQILDLRRDSAALGEQIDEALAQELIEQMHGVETSDQGYKLVTSDLYQTLLGYDGWEMETTRFDEDFIHSCLAIAVTVRAWKQHLAEHGSYPGFTVIESGKTTVTPMLPVYDMDLLVDQPTDEQVLDVAGEKGLLQSLATEPDRSAVQPLLKRVYDWVTQHGDEADHERMRRILGWRARHIQATT